MTHFTESKEEYVGGQSCSVFFLKGMGGHILPVHMNSHKKEELLREPGRKGFKSQKSQPIIPSRVAFTPS